MLDLFDEAQRRRPIAWATAFTANTPLAPQAYERELLERFARGEFDLDQVLLALDAQVQHVLYRSEAVQPFTSPQLTLCSWHQICSLLHLTQGCCVVTICPIQISS